MVAELVMREGSLEDLELCVYTLRHAVVDCLNDSRDRRKGDVAQGDEELEGAESNADNFVGQLMKTMTGRGRFSICRLSVVIIGKSRNLHTTDATDACLRPKSNLQCARLCAGDRLL
jgi:hypothetical protein